MDHCRRLGLLVGVPFMLFGCGGSNDPPAPLGLDDFVTQLGEVACRLDVLCGDIGASEEKHCRGQVTLKAEREAVAAGRLTFDGAAARACIDKIRRVYGCASSTGFVACLLVFRGTVAQGDACFGPSSFAPFGDCSDGATCTARNGCPGTCQSQGRMVVPIGGACGDFAHECSPYESWCSPDTRTCVAAKGAGAPCGFDTGPCAIDLACTESGVCSETADSGGTCGFRVSCPRDQHCVYKGGDSGICTPRAREGESCNDERGACQDGLGCFLGKCRRYLDAGAACDQGLCPQSMWCAGGKCTPAPVSGVGGPCGRPDSCQDGLSCDPATRRCGVPIAVGGKCGPPAFPPCVAGSACDPMTNTCVSTCQ